MDATMEWFLFLLCLLASGIGSLVGAGGGVIIKPVLDFFAVMPVADISFGSGCTVLAMAIFSLIAARGGAVRVQLHTSTPLAIGAVAGGLLGKALFAQCQLVFGNGGLLGAVQNACLMVLTLLLIVYMRKKPSLRSLRVQNRMLIVLVGAALGMISSFLGIGGGPFNLAVLYFFFSMQAKEAALNSLYVILFSQTASLIMTVSTGAVPHVPALWLAAMVVGGVAGAIAARHIGRRMGNHGIERVLQAMMVLIVLLSTYNVLRYVMA